jgi:hypothetical protein
MRPNSTRSVTSGWRWVYCHASISPVSVVSSTPFARGKIIAALGRVKSQCG